MVAERQRCSATHTLQHRSHRYRCAVQGVSRAIAARAIHTLWASACMLCAVCYGSYRACSTAPRRIRSCGVLHSLFSVCHQEHERELYVLGVMHNEVLASIAIMTLGSCGMELCPHPYCCATHLYTSWRGMSADGVLNASHSST